MNVLSLFDGISSGMVALERAGIKVDDYFASEIKEDAIKVSDANYPKISRLGAVEHVKLQGRLPVDLLIGGSPCTDLSRANKSRKGLQGDKSKLFYEYLRVLNEVKPKYFLLENVVMKKDQQDIITGHLGVEPIRINSSLVSAALRDRLYWTNIPNVTVPADKGITLQSILTSGYTNRTKARALLESDSRPLSDPQRMLRRYINGFTTIIFNSQINLPLGNAMPNLVKITDKNGREHWCNLDCRYMNQTELERCMTLPDGYTSVLSRNKAAGVLGDSWTVDVISHIFKGL